MTECDRSCRATFGHWYLPWYPASASSGVVIRRTGPALATLRHLRNALANDLLVLASEACQLSVQCRTV